MLQRNPLNSERVPADRQIVEVRIGNEWQPATYTGGEFIDIYGMPLDRRRISSWRPVNSNAGNQA